MHTNMKQNSTLPDGIEINGLVDAQTAQILSPEAIQFLAKLAREFEPTRQALLAKRLVRQKEIDAGTMPDFLSATKDIREGNWRVASIIASSWVAMP